MDQPASHPEGKDTKGNQRLQMGFRDGKEQTVQKSQKRERIFVRKEKKKSIDE